MIKRLSSVILILAVIVGLVFSLSGCSAPVPRQTEFEKPIAIGLILPLKGDFQTYGQLCKNAIDLAVDQINLQGGVLGKNIEAIPGDDTSNGNIAQHAAENFAQVQKVAAIVGPYTNESALMAAPVANKASTPLVAIRASESGVTKVGNFIFRACYVDNYQGTLLARFAGRDLKAKRAAIVYNSGDPDIKTLNDNFKKEFEKHGGQVAVVQAYDNNTKDYTQLLTQVQKANPDVMLLPDFEDKAGLIMKKAREMGIKSVFLGTDLWNLEKLVGVAGSAAIGSYVTSHFSPEDPDERAQEFAELYEGDYGIKPGPSAALSYDAISLVVEAMKRANSAEPDKIRAELAKIDDFKGVTGTYKFDKDRNPVKGGVIIKVAEDGQEFEKRIEP